MENEKKGLSDAAAQRMRNKMLGLPAASESVGYKNPPTEHRFKKGSSGNPNGRPRKRPLQFPAQAGSKSIGELLDAELDRELPVTEGGKEIAMPVGQAFTKTLLQQALKGKVGAANTLYRIHKDHAAEKRARMEAERASVEADHEHWRDYIQKYLTLKANLERAGKSSDWLPKPDEISFPLNGKTVVDAAQSEAEWNAQLVLRDFRDAFFYQAAWEITHLNISPARGHSLLQMVSLNQSLRMRLRWSKEEMDKRFNDLISIPRRQLSAERTSAWAKVGFPNMSEKLHYFEANDALLKKVGVLKEVRELEQRAAIEPPVGRRKSHQKR